MIDEIAKAKTPAAAYIAKWADEEFLWDELAAAAWIDPGIITKEEMLAMDIDISHAAGYGNTLVWLPANQPGLGEQVVHVQTDLNLDKFNKMVIDLLSRPATIDETSRNNATQALVAGRGCKFPCDPARIGFTMAHQTSASN